MTSVVQKQELRNWLQFIAAFAIVSVIWLAVLPGISQLTPVQKHLELLDRHHIDAGAMFYTELAPGVIPQTPLLQANRTGKTQ